MSGSDSSELSDDGIDDQTTVNPDIIVKPDGTVELDLDIGEYIVVGIIVIIVSLLCGEILL